jgi:hypothetical protein
MANLIEENSMFDRSLIQTRTHRRNFRALGITSLAIFSVIALTILYSFTVGTRMAGAKMATITVCASGCDFTTLQAAVTAASNGDTINVGAGTYVLTSTVNVNVTNLTIAGAGSATTVFQIAQAVGNAFSINAAGVTMKDLQIQKTDLTGVHELILVNAAGDNFTLQNSLIQGPDPGTPWSVNGIVSRALVSSTGGVTGLLIQNNTIKHLRQPAYFNPGTVGTVSNNNVSGTRGWVVDGATINFTGNTWGPPVNQGADIALLASCNPADYSNLVAISTANSNAFISAQFTSAPAAPFNGRATAFVDAAAAAGGDGSSGLPYQTIAAGIGGALFGGTVNVVAGTYTELVNANRSLTFTGTGLPMVMAPAGSNQTIFTIAADNVTIQGFKINVNRPNAAAGIAAIDPSPFNGTQILNNTIQSTGTGSTFSTPVGNTSAAGIALLGNGGAIESVTIKGNTINSGDATNFFSRAIWLREVRSTVGGATAPEGNMLVATTQDLLSQFASGGTTLVQNNTFNGAGLDLTEPNNSPSTINIQNNQFAPGSPLFSQSCLIKHNYLNVPVNIANNTFTGHTTGIWTGGSQNVTISGNTFTPATGLASYQNIRVDTAWPGTQVAPFNSNSVSISGNTLNGAASSSGVGISFRNGQKANTTDPDFSSVTLSSNNFNATLTEFMRLDNTSGQEFQNNLDGSTSQYDVGAGLQLPSAMSAAQLAALENKVFHKLDNPVVGLVTFVANTIFVSSTGASSSTPTAIDNDYTRINNAVLAAAAGTTIKLNGTFNWMETNAAASWAAGSDGNAGATADNYSIYVPANLNNVTFTANTLGDATIQGPGDLAAVDLEAVLYFDGGDNQNWTISNIRFLDFDNAIGMFQGAGGTDAFTGTKILNNYIRLATDLDSSVAPNDTAQNIAIHLSYGMNQMVSGNTIEIPGNGVRINDAAEVVLQSNTSGGNIYGGLQITNNIIRVLQAQSANPEVVIGIWDNCHAHSSNITISGNSFTNLAGGNNPATNLQRAFRVTSHSSAATTVKYENNTVQGANIGFQWRFGPFTGNQPVQLISNTITGNNTGVDVAEDGVALLKFNRIVGNLAAGVAGNSATQIIAENNWWGCNFGPGATGAGCSGTPNGASNSGAGGIDFNPWLVLGVTASPTTVAVGNNSTLTASLKKNSDNLDTSLMGMGLFPDGVTVGFGGALGTASPTSATTAGALAGSAFTAGGTPGAGSGTATVDGQTVSAPITVTAGPLASLAFVQQPTNTVINGTISPAVTVQAKDAFNNNLSGVSVTLSLSMGTGTLNGTLTQVTNGSGIATFNNLGIDAAGSGKKLTATSGAITTMSNSFTILPVPLIVYVDDNWIGATPGTDPDGGGPATSFGYDAFATIQNGVNAVATNGQVVVYAGTYIEDVSINRTMIVGGAGVTSVISGAIGGAGSTVAITASNVEFKNFKITREGNTSATWNDPNLNSAGVSIASSVTGINVHDNLFVQNRTGIDINNSSGHTVRNNVFTDNRTGLIFRNQTDNLTVVENEITDNWTVGILFLDASGGTNSPLQQALNSTFFNNNISANWYGQIVDRQSGGSLPTPGTTNLKNFSGNWFGTNAPVVTTANSAEPGYAAQIPFTVPGGSATPPGGQPDVAGSASANFDLTPLLDVGTDTNAETTPGRGTYGFQGSFNVLDVIASNAQTGPIGRIQEGINLVNTGGTVKVLAGTYTENVNVNKAGTLAGTPTINGTLTTSAAGAIVSPGFSPGIINSGNLSLTSGSTLSIETASNAGPGTGHDQVNVTGTVSLGGATLNLTNSFMPVGGTTFTIINNDGSDAVTGTLNGLPEGTVFTAGGSFFRISYVGGSGNDVVLTANTPPTIACPGNITRNTDSGQCTAVVAFSPTAGGTPAPTVTCVPASGSAFAKGVTTVNCTASNGVGSNASCSFTVTVNDAQPPTVICPANIMANTATGQCSAAVTYTTPTAMDNCSGSTVVCSPASGSTFQKGTTTVTCTATDASSNTASCSFSVTVVDNQAPTITCPANQSAIGTGPTVVTYPAPTANDNCSGVTASCTPASGSTFQVGTTTVNCTATDAANNTGTCSFTVTVTTCTLTCPSDLTVGTTGTSATVNYTAPTAVGSCGTVTCTPASGSSFQLGTTTVTCNSSLGSRTCAFRVTVERVNFSVADPLACSGPGNVVTGTFTVTNNGNASVAVNASVALPIGLVGVPGSGLANVGTAGVTNTAVDFQATLAQGQTATVSYQAQIGDQVASGTVLCSNLTVAFNGGPASTLQACTTVNCPSANPGLIPPASSESGDQKTGSVLIYNIYTSSTDPTRQNTRINITNANSTLPAFVHLFFVAEGCSIADSYLCLTGSQTASFLASDLDPGTTGYIVALAVNSIGCPINFNYLIGDEYVKFASGHAANLSAQSFSALAGGLPACDPNSVTATIAFDGVSYNRTPRTLADSNVGSRADGNDTLLIVNRIGGNLGIGASTLGTLFGILYDDAENSLSFSVTGNCQLRGSLSNNFPRTAPRYESFIPAGRTGWLKIFSQSDVGITGSAINFNPNSVSSTGAFNQGHNLHVLTLSNAASYVIPVFPPSC